MTKRKYRLREFFTIQKAADVVIVGPCVVELTDAEAKLEAHKIEELAEKAEAPKEDETAEKPKAHKKKG